MYLVFGIPFNRETGHFNSALHINNNVEFHQFKLPYKREKPLEKVGQLRLLNSKKFFK